MPRRLKIEPWELKAARHGRQQMKQAGVAISDMTVRQLALVAAQAASARHRLAAVAEILHRLCGENEARFFLRHIERQQKHPGAPPVTDQKGSELKVGDHVLVHQLEGSRRAVVVGLNGTETNNKPGVWVDVSIEQRGPEGIPSYCLEKITEPEKVSEDP